jgi:hypothetical protein
MKDRDQARMLLSLAGNDFKAAQGMNDPDVFTDEIFGFHLQQAAEKALKAWLALLGAEYPKKHELHLLLQLLREKGQDTAPFEYLIEYSSFAVQFRYEAYDTGDEPLDRVRTVERLAELIGHIELMMGQHEQGR